MNKHITRITIGVLALGLGACRERASGRDETTAPISQDGEDEAFDWTRGDARDPFSVGEPSSPRYLGPDRVPGPSAVPGEPLAEALEPVRYLEDDARLDYELTRRFFAAPELPWFEGVSVGVRQGVATLRGSVPAEQRRLQAEQLARSLPGVSEVENQLSVRRSPEPPEPISERALLSSVREVLRAHEYTRASVEEGVISLEGQVGSYARAAELLDALRALPGVRGVRSALEITQAPDATQ